jgi:hypothetical protein
MIPVPEELFGKASDFLSEYFLFGKKTILFIFGGFRDVHGAWVYGLVLLLLN